ncbi:DoxX family protein [Candidatus Woesearchaeota archaeon]|nr:DoxX family protein [Candidatus Woesearchaeota archaeon]
MAYEIWFLAGRIIVGIYYIMSGINHFTKKDMMAGYAKSKNVPMPALAVLLTGIMLLLGGLSLLLGVYPYYGIGLIAVFLLFTTFIMHNFWAVPQEQKMMDMINFMKNMALLGYTLMLLAFPVPWPFSWTI